MPSFWRHRTETPQGVGAGVGGPSHSDSNKDRPCRSHTASARGGCAWGRPQSTPSVGTVLPQERGLRRGSCRPGSRSGGAACRGRGTRVATEPRPPCAQGLHHSVLLRGRREHPGRRDVQVRVHLPRQGAGPEEEVCDLLQPVAGRHGGACAPRPGSVGLSGSPARVCVTP